jgi:hypothetical protein
VLAEPVDKNDPKSVRKLRRIAEKLVECAMKGEGWAISQVADRIDGKATAEIQTEQRHRYVIEAPAQLTREQWIQEYSPSPPIGKDDIIPVAQQLLSKGKERHERACVAAWTDALFHPI